MNTIKKILAALLASLLFAPAAYAAGDNVKLDHAPINPNDMPSLQRGAKLFVNYCLNCHSANYMRYNRLQDLGLNEKQIFDNLVFTGVKVGDLMKIAMDPKDAKDQDGKDQKDRSNDGKKPGQPPRKTFGDEENKMDALERRSKDLKVQQQRGRGNVRGRKVKDW